MIVPSFDGAAMVPDPRVTAMVTLYAQRELRKRRIPGDGDGDGIPNEGDKGNGKRGIGYSRIKTLAGRMGVQIGGTNSEINALVNAARNGSADQIGGAKASKPELQRFKEALLAEMKGAPAKPKAPAAKPAQAAPAAKPAATAKPAAAKPGTTPKAASDAAHAAATISLSAREVEAMQNYTGGMFQTLNPRLRAGKAASREDKADLQSMDAAFARAATKEPIVAYRGVSGDFAAKLKPGVTYTDGGFTSVSSDPKAADNFVRGDGSALLEVRVPKGSKAVSVKAFSQFKGEEEIVLNRGGNYRVVDRINGDWKTPARIIVEYYE